MRLFVISLSLFIAMFLSSACSAGKIMESPTIPNDPDTSDMQNKSFSSVLVSDWDESGNPVAGTGFMGVYTCHIDSESLTGELTPLRDTGLTDTLETVDITNFLKMAPCTDCATLDSIQLDADGNITATIGIKHPFRVGDPFKPITGQNRADLHVFNVEGICVIESPDKTSFSSLGMTISDSGLLNADGLTAYLDDSLDELFLTEANAHPYITHFDDYSTGNFNPSSPTGFESVVDPPPSGNLVMAMGCEYDFQDYVFQFNGGDFEFLFAIGCTYAVSAGSKNQRFTPEYRVPQHNKKAASEVRVEVTQNNLAGGDPLSTAELTISVLDINHGVETGTNLDQMLADSSVADIQIEIPGITGGIQNDYAFIDGDGRDPDNPLTYTATVTNSAGGGEGTYTGLVKVLDSYPPGQNTFPLLNSMDGIKRVNPEENPIAGLFEIAEFATYATFEIEIISANEPPIAVLQPDPARVCEGGTLIFDATGSYDNDGSIVRYEWDWDLPSGDPVDFVMDESTIDGTAESQVYPTAGETFVAVRVFDDGSPELYDTAVVPITIASYNVDFEDIVDVPTSGILNINYSHTQDTLAHETHQRYAGMEGLAKADGYIYAAFFGEESGEGGIYFTRTNDNGMNWDTPTKIASITPGAVFSGCSIDAASSEVHIVYTQSGYHLENPLNPNNDGKVYLLSNYDHGEGTFDETVVRDMGTGIGIGHLDVAVDPNDTNNIYVGYGQYSAPWYAPNWWYYDYIRISVSNSGATGPYTEQVMDGASPEPDDNYGVDVAVSPVDGDVYVMGGFAYHVVVYRSDDYGASFPTDADHYERFYAGGYYWARDFDLALHPTNGDIYYVALACRRSTPFPVRIFRSTDGINLTQVTSSIVDVSSARQIMPAIIVGPEGDVYVSWTDNRSGNYEIYIDHMPPSGNFGTDIQVSAGSATNEKDPEIIVTPDGCDVVIVWEENGDQPDGTLKSRTG